MNEQKIEGVDHDLYGRLSIIDIWHTIQGEGPYAGTPAIFVRLAGCDLDCPLCDTNYTKGRYLTDYTKVVEKITEIDINRKTNLVVFTGGEPFRQNIMPLLFELGMLRYKIQIETNGTLWIPTKGADSTLNNVTLVCSPKTTIHQRLRPHIEHLKYIVKEGEICPEDGLPMGTLGLSIPTPKPWPEFGGQIWIQPADEQDENKNRANIKQL